MAVLMTSEPHRPGPILSPRQALAEGLGVRLDDVELADGLRVDDAWGTYAGDEDEMNSVFVDLSDDLRVALYVGQESFAQGSTASANLMVSQRLRKGDRTDYRTLFEIDDTDGTTWFQGKGVRQPSEYVDVVYSKLPELGWELMNQKLIAVDASVDRAQADEAGVRTSSDDPRLTGLRDQVASGERYASGRVSQARDAATVLAARRGWTLRSFSGRSSTFHEVHEREGGLVLHLSDTDDGVDVSGAIDSRAGVSKSIGYFSVPREVGGSQLGELLDEAVVSGGTATSRLFGRLDDHGRRSLMKMAASTGLDEAGRRQVTPDAQLGTARGFRSVEGSMFSEDMDRASAARVLGVPVERVGSLDDVGPNDREAWVGSRLGPYAQGAFYAVVEHAPDDVSPQGSATAVVLAKDRAYAVSIGENQAPHVLVRTDLDDAHELARELTVGDTIGDFRGLLKASRITAHVDGTRGPEAYSTDELTRVVSARSGMPIDGECLMDRSGRRLSVGLDDRDASSLATLELHPSDGSDPLPLASGRSVEELGNAVSRAWNPVGQDSPGLRTAVRALHDNPVTGRPAHDQVVEYAASLSRHDAVAIDVKGSTAVVEAPNHVRTGIACNGTPDVLVKRGSFRTVVPDAMSPGRAQRLEDVVALGAAPVRGIVLRHDDVPGPDQDLGPELG